MDNSLVGIDCSPVVADGNDCFIAAVGRRALLGADTERPTVVAGRVCAGICAVDSVLWLVEL